VRPDGRIPVLDGIRGIAVLLVMVFHFWVFGVAPGTMLWERVYGGAAGMGWAGVDLFFVLSGFLITGILYDSKGSQHYFRVFYARRTVRIFPLYYASLALFFWIIPFLLVRTHHAELSIANNTPLAKLFAWSYLVNWYEGYKGFNVVALPLQHFWSLAVEEQFYLVWPLLVLTLSRRRLMALCCGLMAFGFALRAVLYGIHLPTAAYTWTFCRSDALAIGAIVALAARDSRDWKTVVKWAPRLALPALFAVILVRILNPLCTTGPGSSPSFFMGTFAISLVGIFFGSCLAMAVCLRQESRMHRILGSSFLRFFGKYSYCLYICHVPIIVVFAKIGMNSDHLTKLLHHKLLAVVAVNGAAFAATIAIALVSWNLFEKQWLKLKDLPFLRREDQPSGEATEEKTEPLFLAATKHTPLIHPVHGNPSR
jgi:peptidoglycan/LPS O-acetylase OafA/YrhL